MKRKDKCKCGNLKWSTSDICLDCYKKWQKNPKNNPNFGRKGKLAFNYKNGKTLKKYYCKCDNEINYHAYLYGKNKRKLCKGCVRKLFYKDPKNNPMYGKHHTKQTKAKISKTRIKKGLGKGNKNGRWIDGRSYEKYPSEFNEQLRKKIRKRDNYECQNCDMSQEEHFIVYGRDLNIHHIDYNRNNCNEENLLTLCQGCNLRANFNREHWIIVFKRILNLE